MSYDANGNLLQATDARGSTVSYTYDALNRKTGEYAATTGSQSASNQLASWVYDNANNVAGVTDPVGQLTTETSYSGGAAYVIQQKAFNKFGESLGETVTIPSAAGTLAGTYTFGHAYEANTGLPYSDTYPASGGLPAETVLHGYLAPFDLPAGLGGSIDGYAQTTSYDAYGDILQETIGTGSNLAYITSTYDPHTLRLTDSLVTRHVTTPAAVDDEQYAYDLSGNITRQVSTRLGSSATSETQCFGYDALDRLTAAWTATDGCAATPTSASHSTVGDGLGTASEYWTSYSYDPLGDLTSQVQHNSVTGGTDTTTTNTYNGNGTGQPHTLTASAQSGGSTATAAFGYDKSGNMTTRDVPATGSQTLTWNAAGQLTTVTSTAGTTSYTYDADGTLLLQQDPGSTTLYLPGEQLTATGTTVTGARIIPLPSGGDVVRTGATTSYSFEIPDIRGTSTLYLDNTAQTPTWRQFTPYGAPRGTPATWIDNRAFLGKPADTATGLTSLGARQYDPVTGQFISPDPILIPADPQDLNPYAYATDNPVTRSDPTGLLTCNQWGECYLSTASVPTVHVTPQNLGGPQDQTPITPPAPWGGGNAGGGTPHLPVNPCFKHLSMCLPLNTQLNPGDQEAPGNGYDWSIPVSVCAALTLGLRVACPGIAVSAATGGSSGEGGGQSDSGDELDVLFNLLLATDGGDVSAAEDLLTRLASKVTEELGPGDGPSYGMRAHTAFARIIRALPSDEFSSEISYRRGVIVQNGTAGSVRPDVVFGDPKEPIAIFDLKTGTGCWARSGSRRF